jgi:hypothetical protein
MTFHNFFRKSTFIIKAFFIIYLSYINKITYKDGLKGKNFILLF